MDDALTGEPVFTWRAPLTLVALVASLGSALSAHDGPPYPVVTDRVAGEYSVSVWTDPDTTDDGSAAGQFWVILAPSEERAGPKEPRVSVAIQPRDRPGPRIEAVADRDTGDPTRFFAALPMDHEGRFGVTVTIQNGPDVAVVDTEVEATYDQRPAPILIAIYAVPFLLAGILWLNLLVRRRQARQRRFTHTETSHE